MAFERRLDGVENNSPINFFDSIFIPPSTPTESITGSIIVSPVVTSEILLFLIKKIIVMISKKTNTKPIKKLGDFVVFKLERPTRVHACSVTREYQMNDGAVLTSAWRQETLC